MAVMVGLSVLLAWWAFPRAVEDWRFQLAGLASWFFGRPDPAATIFVGVVASTIIIHIASVADRRGHEGRDSVAPLYGSG